MNNKHKISRDRSGVSAILVVVVVAIVIVAGVAAFVVLSNDDKEDNRQIAPGTKFTFDIETHGAVFSNALTMEIVGQNDTNYFIKNTTSIPLFYAEDIIEYVLDTKDNSNDAVKIGTKEIDTFEGKKTLDMWEKTDDDDSKTTIYADALMVPYLMEMEESTATLKAKEIVYQDSYQESDNIGKKFTYRFNGTSALDYILVTECVADCLNGQYGMKFTPILGDESISELYYLSDVPGGMSTASEDSGSTVNFTTIDGQKTMEVWVLESTIYFCADPETDMVYLIGIYSSGVTVEFILESYL